MSAARLRVDLAAQRLYLIEQGVITRGWAVSTAANGAGECHGSECTPRGRHRIVMRIGEGCPENTVFIGRRPSGEIYTPELAARHPGRDWILTRILWLGGLEPGRNRGGQVDTQRRFIYIHGAPDSVPMGQPGSHGCVRMRNADLLELFPLTFRGMRIDMG